MKATTVIPIRGTIISQPSGELIVAYNDADGQKQEAPLKYSQYDFMKQHKAVNNGGLYFGELYMTDKLGVKLPVIKIYRKQFFAAQLN